MIHGLIVDHPLLSWETLSCIANIGNHISDKLSCKCVNVMLVHCAQCALARVERGIELIHNINEWTVFGVNLTWKTWRVDGHGNDVCVVVLVKPHVKNFFQPCALTTKRFSWILILHGKRVQKTEVYITYSSIAHCHLRNYSHSARPTQSTLDAACYCVHQTFCQFRVVIA